MRDLQTVFALDSSEVRLSILIKRGAFRAGQIGDELFNLPRTEDNLRFSISSVLKLSVIVLSERDIFINYIAVTFNRTLLAFQAEEAKSPSSNFLVQA